MRIIGDVHGEIDKYLTLLPANDKSIQIGDMGIGFENVELPVLESHKFFRGNHDNPKICQQHPNYLGDWGYLPEEGIFWFAGADSIDKDMRIPGISWWNNEQLSYAEFFKAIDLYTEVKPKIVLSHDAPLCVLRKMYSFVKLSATSQALERAFEIHQPEKWFFGHHHVDIEVKIDKTLFRCVGELSYVDI